MPSIGKLDRRIIVQRATVADDGFASEVDSWSDFVAVWAMRRDVSDGEKLATGQVGARLQSRFTVRSSNSTRTITPQDRVSHDGAFWEIVGVKETPDGRNRFIEITAVKDAD
jgi:head-tail adaptor